MAVAYFIGGDLDGVKRHIATELRHIEHAVMPKAHVTPPRKEYYDVVCKIVSYQLVARTPTGALIYEVC